MTRSTLTLKFFFLNLSFKHSRASSQIILTVFEEEMHRYKIYRASLHLFHPVSSNIHYSITEMDVDPPTKHIAMLLTMKSARTDLSVFSAQKCGPYLTNS